MTFTDALSSSEIEVSDDSDKEAPSLVKKRTKKLTVAVSSSSNNSSDSDEKPYDSSEQLSARTKHTAHSVKSADESPSDDDGGHSDDSNYSSPSQFLDCEAEEVWQSDEGCGSDDMQDFIVDDAVEDWGSCDAAEVDNNSRELAQSVSPKRCHGRKLLDSSSESDEEANGECDLY